MAEIAGSTTKEKGTFIPVEKRLPYNRDLLFKSKAGFLEIERLRKEKELRLKEASEQFDKEQKLKKEESKPTKKPKKIE